MQSRLFICLLFGLFSFIFLCDNPAQATPHSNSSLTICTTNNAGEACDYIADGIDDQVQIQQAIDEIFFERPSGATQGGAGGKGKIIFLEGVYNINATIFVKPGIHLQGQGLTSTVLKAGDNLNANLFEFKENQVNPSAGLIFEGLYFDGNKFANQTGSAFDSKTGAVALWDVHFVRCLFFDFADTVLRIRDPWGFRFVESQIEDSNAGGILITAGDSKRDGASILNSKIIQIGSIVPASAISLDGVNGSRIVDNEFNSSGAAKYAVEIINGRQNSIVGNNVTGGSSGFFTDYQSAGNMFIGNSIMGLSGHGIIITTLGLSNIIIGNTFSFVSGVEIADFGTDTVHYGNRGEADNPLDSTNYDITPNRVAVGKTVPQAQLDVLQNNPTSGQAVIKLEQTDDDQPLIELTGVAADDQGKSIFLGSTQEAVKFGAFRVKVNGQTRWVRLYNSPN